MRSITIFYHMRAQNAIFFHQKFRHFFVNTFFLQKPFDFKKFSNVFCQEKRYPILCLSRFLHTIICFLLYRHANFCMYSIKKIRLKHPSSCILFVGVTVAQCFFVKRIHHRSAVRDGFFGDIKGLRSLSSAMYPWHLIAKASGSLILPRTWWHFPCQNRSPDRSFYRNPPPPLSRLPLPKQSNAPSLPATRQAPQ